MAAEARPPGQTYRQRRSRSWPKVKDFGRGFEGSWRQLLLCQGGGHGGVVRPTARARDGTANVRRGTISGRDNTNRQYGTNGRAKQMAKADSQGRRAASGARKHNWHQGAGQVVAEGHAEIRRAQLLWMARERVGGVAWTEVQTGAAAMGTADLHSYWRDYVRFVFIVAFLSHCHVHPTSVFTTSPAL